MRLEARPDRNSYLAAHGCDTSEDETAPDGKSINMYHPYSRDHPESAGAVSSPSLSTLTLQHAMSAQSAAEALRARCVARLARSDRSGYCQRHRLGMIGAGAMTVRLVRVGGAGLSGRMDVPRVASRVPQDECQLERCVDRKGVARDGGFHPKRQRAKGGP